MAEKNYFWLHFPVITIFCFLKYKIHIECQLRFENDPAFFSYVCSKCSYHYLQCVNSVQVKNSLFNVTSNVENVAIQDV